MADPGNRPPPVLIVPGRFRYHEVTLNVWAAFLGVVYLLGAPQPTSVVTTVPEEWRWPWAVGLAVGGAVALIGCYWLTDVERGLELERAGLVMLSGGLVVYVVAVFTFAGWPGLASAGLASAWMTANIARSVQITRDVRHIRRRRATRGDG